MAPADSTTDVLQTVFIGAQLVVLIAAAVFGWRQLREARSLREQQTRPFVVIDLDDNPRPKIYDLVVRNIGATLARNVTFTFNPPMKSTIEEAALERLKMFREGISSLPPGKEIRMAFDTGPARFGSDLPDAHEVTVRYSGPTRRTPYEERMDLDFGLYWNRLSVRTHDLHDLHGEVKGIGKTLASWSAQPGPGLLLVSLKDLKRKNRAIAEQPLWWKPETQPGRVVRAARRVRDWVGA